jgi:23S rRNA (uracil1939-C5)-methyltransferase
VLAAVWDYIKRRNVAIYNETTHTGLMRQVMVRTSIHANEVMVVCVVNGSSLPHEDELANQLTAAGATTVLINPHTKKGNAVLGETFRTLSGDGFIRQQIGPIQYQLSPGSFFQVNTRQAGVLYEKAVNMAGLKETDTIIDAHAGVGGVALYAARNVKRVFGVDIIPSAVVDASKNAALNGITNAEFICGAAEKIIPLLLEKNTVDAIFFDPPRKGCGNELLDAVIQAKIGKIIYISCEPATLARDIKRCSEGGYTLAEAQPVDMFPMTGKVETVCLLTMIVHGNENK